MSWYAIDAIDDAFETARSFLFPFEIGRWLRLAVIVFFLGASSAGNIDIPRSSLSGVPSDVLLLLTVVLLVFVLVFSLIGRVMEFVLLESIHTDSVHIRRYFRQQFWRGVRLLLFEIGIVLLAASPFVVILLLVDPSSLFVLSMILLLLAAVLVVGVLLDFTVRFVVPVMLLEECGVLDGWRRFWPTLKDEWKQYAVYVVINFFLGIGVAVVFFIGFLIAMLVTLLVVGLPMAIVFELSTTAGLVALVVAIPVGLFLLLAALLALQILVTVYFKYYSLHVLRKTNAEFDLIPYVDDDSDSESTAVGE